MLKSSRLKIRTDTESVNIKNPMMEVDQWFQIICYNFTTLSWYSDVMNGIPVIISFLNNTLLVYMFSENGPTNCMNSPYNHTELQKCFHRPCEHVLQNYSRTPVHNIFKSSMKSSSIPNLCCRTNISEVVKWLDSLPKHHLQQLSTYDHVEKIQSILSNRKRLKRTTADMEIDEFLNSFKKLLQRYRRDGSNRHVASSTATTPSSRQTNQTRSKDEEFKDMYDALSLEHSKDPQWALVSVVSLLGMMVFAACCMKLSRLPKSDVIHVHYSQSDWSNLIPLKDVLRSKCRFLPGQVIQHRQLLAKCNNSIQHMNIVNAGRVSDTDLDTDEEDCIYNADAYTKLLR